MLMHPLEPRALWSARPTPMAPPNLASPEIEGIWRRLWTGEVRVVGCRNTETSCQIEVVRVAQPTPPDPKALGLLTRLLLGVHQKVIAIELDRSPSTVTQRATRALAQLGIGCSPGAVPMALVLLAYAAHHPAPQLHGRVSTLGSEPTRRVVSFIRPTRTLAGVLTPAEREVLELLLDAPRRSDISSSRRRSGRTIANQLSQVYKKLGTSGRAAIIVRLIERESERALNLTLPNGEWMTIVPSALNQYTEARP